MSWFILSLILASITSASASRNRFDEILTLHPLPDGKLSVAFEFITHFELDSTSSSQIPQSHHSLTPPSLLLPLVKNNVSELTISFVSGRWDPQRSGEAGPLTYDASGGGGEVRGWMREESGVDSDQTWTAMTHALGGLFCAGLGPNDAGESVKTYGGVYPPLREPSGNLTHRLLSYPHLPLCTENLTPFLSLLPSKGLSGISHLLSKPGVIFSWGFKTEGVEVIMPSPENSLGRWRGWWEGVVDLVPSKGGSRAFSINSLFGQNIPRPFPLASTSILRVIKPLPADGRREWLRYDEDFGENVERWQWVDGSFREVIEWDLTQNGAQGKDIRFWWDGEGIFQYPRTISPPSLVVSRTVASRFASDGTFRVRLENNGDVDHAAVYSEIWPWWVKGWMSEMSVSLEGVSGDHPDLIKSINYNPSTPPQISTTTVHLSLTIPSRSTLIISIPFTKLTLKYTEHRPDAERGVEISSGVLTLLDLVGESETPIGGDVHIGQRDPTRSSRVRIYTSKLLLDVPTPDFSMPYNVIIMSSTVIAVCLGLMHSALGRRWGWIEVALGSGGDGVKGKTE